MDGISGIQSKDGSFYLDGVKMDLATAIMALQMEKVECLDEQLAAQMKDVQNRNKQLKFYNEVMNSLRSGKTEFDITDPSVLPEGMLEGMLDAGILKYRVDVTEQKKRGRMDME